MSNEITRGASNERTALENLEALYRAALASTATDQESARSIAFEAVAISLMLHRLPPAWATEAFNDAAGEWFTYKVETLGEAFECPERKHLSAKRDELLCWRIAERVAELQGSGLRLVGNYKRKGAYDIAAAEFNMSAKKVEDLLKRWRDIWKNEDQTTLRKICNFEIFGVPKKT
jgi:hypothetical protein